VPFFRVVVVSLSWSRFSLIELTQGFENIVFVGVWCWYLSRFFSLER